MAENTPMPASSADLHPTPVAPIAPAPRERGRGGGRSLSKIILFAILSVFALMGLVGLVVIAFSAGAFLRHTPPSTFTAGVATIDQVRSLKLLTVLSFEVTSDMEAEHAERKGLWLARGSADYVVDFSQAQVLDKDEERRVISMRLPRPTVRNAKLDPVRTKMLTYEKTGLGWWTFGASGSRDEFERQSRVMLQKRIEVAANEAALLDSAKGSAVQLMGSLYAPLNWTVKVEWEESPKPVN